jgi:hypothetical protein
MQEAVGLDVKRHIIQVTLTNYWHETISRDEAVRRLETRNLPTERKARILSGIPERTEHYLAPHGNGLLEYVDCGEGFARLLLILKLQKGPNGTLLVGSRHGDGKRHVHETKDGVLVENGVPRPSFRFAADPIALSVDASFLDPGLPPTPIYMRTQKHPTPGQSVCCDMCEWVHSVTDYHEYDADCCVGGCNLS